MISIIGFIFLIPALIVLICVCFANLEYGWSKLLATFAILIIAFLTLSLFDTNYKISIVSTHKVNLIENVALINRDREIINLNRSMNRNFKEGDEIEYVMWNNPTYYGYSYRVKKNIEVEDICP